MIWLTWRQVRIGAMVALAGLAVLAIALAVSGPHIAHLYDTSGVATCTATTCQQVTTNFLNSVPQFDQILYALCLLIMLVTPAVIGVFWGAPLVSREIEARTLPLAWNQSVTRTRWLAWKLAVLGLIAVLNAGLLSLMVTWWSSPGDTALEVPYGHRVSFQRLGPILFGTRAIVPAGYAAFAFALGVLAGVLLRRTVPAMAATLGVYLAVMFSWPNWIRPYLIAPAHASLPLTLADFQGIQLNNGTVTALGGAQLSQPGAWVLSSQVVDQAGHPFVGTTQACLHTGPSQQCMASLARLHLSEVFSYQPASRFWDFQWIETAVFGGLALLLAGACIWLVNRRRSVT